MIHVRKISQMGQYELSELGQEEMKNWGTKLSGRVWEVYENGRFMCVFGLKFESLVGMGTLVWFAAGKDFTKLSRRGWRALHRTMRRLRGRFYAYVREDLRHACRMARFFGFRVTGQSLNYKVYERWQP
jgi:hypothetical protein